MEYLLLACETLRFALPMDEIEEVLTDGVYAAVPSDTPYLWGVCYRRGKLYPAFRLAEGGSGPAALGVLCCQNGIEAVFLADAVEGLEPIGREQMGETGALAGIGQLLQQGPRTLWLPQLKELTAGGRG